MKTRVLAVSNVALLSAIVWLAAEPTIGFAFPDDKPAAGQPAVPTTEDVVYMTDGRELHGKIVSETKSQVVFEYKNADLNIKTKLTLDMDKIAHIDRNVAIKDATKAGAEKPAAMSSSSADKKKAADDAKTYGAARITTNDSNVPTFYIVPMKGQMGTDINAEVYPKIRDDIKLLKPDVVVIEMECLDDEDLLYSLKDKKDAGIVDMDDYRKMCNIFQDDLRPFKQVCWVYDSQGISSIVAMTWSQMYMKPAARLGGLIVARNDMGFEFWADDDVRGKMTAAFMAWMKGFLESGHYAFELADAMVRPKFSLSATWKGREVIWSLDTSGEYVVDSSDKRTTEFHAKDAEDLCVSKGTAESLDDLALLLGYRQYRVLDGQGEKICKDYVADWRRAYDDCRKLFLDVQQYMGWASGNDEVKYLGKAKTALEQILAKLELYKPLETRLGRDFGVKKLDLEVLIEQIKERLRALKASQKPTGGGGMGGGRGPSGGRGPGPG